MEVYKELEGIFSQDNNEEAQRDVLMREGTAKFAVTTRETDRHMQKIFQKQVCICQLVVIFFYNSFVVFTIQNMLTSHGTIPYLGLFLFDLTMIDTVSPDKIPNTQMINFDKKRKEFEVLAQIKLLQGAANAYRLDEDPIFDRWFASVLVLTDSQAHERSCQLEPPEQKEPKKGHRKSASIASNSSSGAGSQEYCEINGR